MTNIDDIFNAAREGTTIGGMGGPFEYKYDTAKDYLRTHPDVPRITRLPTIKQIRDKAKLHAESVVPTDQSHRNVRMRLAYGTNQNP
jgi:hypothetical protein